MGTVRLEDLAPGDVVTAWVWIGHWKGTDHNDLICLTVVRVNRKTVTVRNKQGDVQRVEPHHLNSKINPADAW